jgi:hypothetical protein
MNDVIVPAAEKLLQLGFIQVESLDGGSLRLFKNDYTPNSQTVLAELEVADFTGYANKTIATWNAPFLDELLRATCLAPLQTFAATGSTITNLIYGAYYLNVGGTLVWAARFSAPIPMAANGNSIPMVPKFQLL